MEVFFGAIAVVARELALFAGLGLLLSGIDDLAIDLFWLGRTAWRRRFVYTRHPRATVATLPPGIDGRIALFMPAWDEGAFIGDSVRAALRTVGDRDLRLYVGIYPNDPVSRAALAAIGDERLRVATNPRPGPTTKADCLNTLWRALVDDDVARGERSIAVVLHDAEDRLHRDELAVYRAMLGRFDFVQLPVMPLINRHSPFLEGHYADEFAESHGKEMCVRDALGGGIPAAGVGCAFRCGTLERIATARAGLPFDASSLVEDYELGLRLAEIGARRAFVRVRDRDGKALVAVHSAFPTTVVTAVRQKSRWIAGIALAGWDRLGWRGGFAERWFRLHDRKALIAALLLLAAYVDTLLMGVLAVGNLVWDVPMPPLGPVLDRLLLACSLLLMWRIVMRVTFSWRQYGAVQGLLAIPRVLVSNLIAILAVRRAVDVYRRARRDGVVRWDKTQNRFAAAE